MERNTTIHPKLWNRNFIACGISYFLMNFAFYLLMPTLPVFLAEDLKISNSEVGLALSSYTIGVLCVRPFSGYLVDCFSRKTLYNLAQKYPVIKSGGRYNRHFVPEEIAKLKQKRQLNLE